MTVYVPFFVTHRDAVPLGFVTGYELLIGPSKVIFVPDCAPAYCTTIYFSGLHTSATTASEAAEPALTATSVIVGSIKEKD